MAKDIKVINKGGPAGGFYFLTFIGALIYFVDRANGFDQVIWAFLKACVWPAILLNHILTMLNVS